MLNASAAPLSSTVGRDHAMLESFTFWVSILAVLVAYLCVSVGVRWQEEAERYRKSRSPGKAFDVSAIAPQIERVRQDPLGSLQARAHRNPYRTRVLAVARHVIARLPFFGGARSEHELQNHNG
jgi:hypothetical protein